MQNEQSISIEEVTKTEKEHPQLEDKKANAQEIRDTLSVLINTLQQIILSGLESNEKEALAYIKEVSETIKKISKLEAISEYMIVEKHTLIILAINAILLVRVIVRTPGIEEEIQKIEKEYRIDLLTRNIKVANGEIDKTKGILIESLFLNLLTSESAPLLRKIEVSRSLKSKIRVKVRITGTEEYIDKYYISRANAIISQSIEALLPITRDTTHEKLCEILEGVIETENLTYLEQITLSDTLSSDINRAFNLNVRSVIRGLIVTEPENYPKEKETKYALYSLVLKVVVKYIEIKGAQKVQKEAKNILDEIFDEDEIDMMLRLIEKDLPLDIHTDLLKILIEGEIPLLRADSIAITQNNLGAFIRYVIKHPNNTENTLISILSMLEIDLTEDNEELLAEECNLLVVLDFLNMILKRFITEGLPGSVSFQKYISTTVLELYNGLLFSISNPLITTGYLTLLTILTGLDSDTKTYFSSTVQRNLLLSKAVNSIAIAMRQTSNFVTQGETLYMDCPAVHLPPENTLNLTTDQKDTGVINVSVTALFKLSLFLSDSYKVALASGHIMNILFRRLAENDKVPEETLCFIRGFFGCSAVVQKISNSVSNNFFSLVLSLVDRGELETVHELLNNNQKIYKGFFTYDVLRTEIIKSFKEQPTLYSLISTLMIYYYVDNPKMQIEPINKSIIKIFESVLLNFKTAPQIIPLLSDTSELGCFFKASCLLGIALQLNIEDMLFVLLQSSTTLSSIDIKKADVSVLYNCMGKTLAESFFFYHFVFRGVESLTPCTSQETGTLCLRELNNPYTSSVLKYISLLGLSSDNIEYKSNVARLFTEVDLSHVTEEERHLFVNQIYRVLFLTGKIQNSSTSVSAPITSTLSHPVYSYADMCIQSAIQATEDTGSPHTLPIKILATGTPKYVAAFLYTLYEQSPNSAMILSYIKKMRKFIRNDDSVYSRVLQESISQ